MGSPPPEPGIAVTDNAGFAPAQSAATICGFKIGLPRLTIGLSVILPFAFPPKLPFPHIALVLTCDPNDPIKLDAGLRYGGGRAVNADPDPDDDEDSF